jgi:hypothetical protein
MKEILTDLFRRFTSRKFLVTCMAFTITIMQGTGLAEFSSEVQVASATALVAYIGAEGVSDTVARYKNNEAGVPVI